MAKFPYGKKTTITDEIMEEVEEENEPEAPRSESMVPQVDEMRLVDRETAEGFQRLEERDKLRL
eukprot:4750269-Karenia_brevis.AAC.1